MLGELVAGQENISTLAICVVFEEQSCCTIYFLVHGEPDLCKSNNVVETFYLVKDCWEYVPGLQVLDKAIHHSNIAYS